MSPTPYYWFMKNAQKLGQPLEAVTVQGQLYNDRVVFPDGSSIPFNFSMAFFLVSDVAFVEYDPASRTVTPILWTPPAGNPSMNPTTLAVAGAKASWLAEGKQHLEDAAREIYTSIKSGKLTEALARGWKVIGQKWQEQAVQAAMPVETYEVHFTSVSPFFHDVDLRANASGAPETTKSMDDSGAGVNLVAPDLVRKLGLIPGRKVNIEGITPGESEVAQMTKVHVTLKPGVAKEFEAAIYPPLRKKTSAGFLLGRPIIAFARDNGVEGL